MNYNKYIEAAKKLGLESFELYIQKSYRLSIEVFHHEIGNYTVADSIVLAARGIYEGKMGYAYSELNDKTTPLFLAEQVRENAKNEILNSLHDGTFFELYVHKTMSNDFLHIVHFVPDEFFLDKQCVYLLKEKAREFFISHVDNCENAQEFLRIIKLLL